MYLDYKDIHNPFFSIRRLERGDANGLLTTLGLAMIHAGIGTNWKKKSYIGLAVMALMSILVTEVSKNVSMKPPHGVQFVWRLAHRLELSLRDALKNTLFTAVDEMLMRVYYLYEKSPKKCCELEWAILELKACLTEEEMSTQGGSRPIRACGAHFISHKVAALERMIDLFGAYRGHITTLANDSSVKAADWKK